MGRIQRSYCVCVWAAADTSLERVGWYGEARQHGVKTHLVVKWTEKATAGGSRWERLSEQKHKTSGVSGGNCRPLHPEAFGTLLVART